ncbi:MAG: hypothetical protein AAGB31_11920 [Bdellovibrio sp.]
MKKIVPIFLLGLLSACSHLKIQVPQAQVLSPELMAKNNWEIGVRSQASHIHTASEDASARPPTFDNTDTSSALIIPDFIYAPLDGLQFGGGISNDMGVSGNLAYQFLGSPWSQRKIGWSSALRLDVYAASASKDGDQNGIFGAGGYNWKGEIKVVSLGAGLSVGYRFHESFMSFLGFSRTNNTVKTNIDQDPSDNGTDPGGSYSQNLSGSSNAIGLGLMIGSGSFRFTPVVHWLEYELGDVRESETMVNLGIAFNGL